MHFPLVEQNQTCPQPDTIAIEGIEQIVGLSAGVSWNLLFLIIPVTSGSLFSPSLIVLLIDVKRLKIDITNMIEKVDKTVRYVKHPSKT